MRRVRINYSLGEPRLRGDRKSVDHVIVRVPPGEDPMDHAKKPVLAHARRHHPGRSLIGWALPPQDD